MVEISTKKGPVRRSGAFFGTFPSLQRKNDAVAPVSIESVLNSPVYTAHHYSVLNRHARFVHNRARNKKKPKVSQLRVAGEGEYKKLKSFHTLSFSSESTSVHDKRTPYITYNHNARYDRDCTLFCTSCTVFFASSSASPGNRALT
jgi:hypothetical protein